MGFDIECIVNIQSYPGEYFCPVCRTLVFPNEALQSQCTHLYCKPCLTHVANTTKACPYDSYLVTEADSKPLIESDKALAENIGKVKVHCLYHRSGCTWEGILSESSSHCSGCTFGNSSVICNRCGIQIAHRQVHDHAQTCPATYQAPQAPQAVDTNQNAASSTVTASTAYVDQNSQISAAALPSGQAPNQQASASSQVAAVAPSATPTPDQWYQQQYYQQYAGYNPYQQSYQQYYPYPQQVGQTYQQGQYNSQAYEQPQPQPHPPLQGQPQSQPQPQGQNQFQSYPVNQVPTQPQPSQHPHSQSQSQEKVATLPVAVQGANQVQSKVQAAAPNYQQVNPQQQFSSSQQPHPQGNVVLHSQQQPQQYAQVPGYQQPIQSTHPAFHSQNNPQSSQPQNLHQPQIQPQPHLHHQALPYSQQSQINHPPGPNAPPHALHPANAVVTGHQSYQPPQQIPVVLPQQNTVHGQIPQQTPPARLPLSQGSVSNQQNPAAVPTYMPNNQPQLQQLHPHAYPPTSLAQHHPGIQAIQQSQAFHAPLQGQYSNFGQHQPLQSQLRPQGEPHVMKPGALGYNPSQKNTPLVPGFIPQQPQNYGAQPPISAVGGFGPIPHNKPMPLGSSHSSLNNNFAKQESDSLGQVEGQKVELKAGNSGTHIKMEKAETRDGSGSSINKEVKKGGASQPVMQQTVKEEPTGDFSDTPSAGKLLGASAVEENIESGVCKGLESLSNQKDAFTSDRDSQSTHLCASHANGSDKFSGPSKSQSIHSSVLRPQAPGFSSSPLKSQRPDHLPPHAPINGFPGTGSTTSYGRGRGHPLGSFALHSGASQTQSLPGLTPDSVDPRSGMMGRELVRGPEGPLGNRATGRDSSAFGLQNHRFNFQAGEQVNPFSMDQVRPFDQVSLPSRFMPPPPRPDFVPERENKFGVHDAFRGKADPPHAVDFLRPNHGFSGNLGMPPHDREYLGRRPLEPHAVGEGPRPYNLPPDSVGSYENRFPFMPNSMQRIEHSDTEHLSYGEHIAPGRRHNHLRSRDPFEEEIFGAGHSRRDDISGPQNFPGPFRLGDAAGFGAFPGGGRTGEMNGGFPHHLPGRETFRGNFSDFPRLGERGFRNNYSRQGFGDHRFYADDLTPFDKSRKCKPVSTGWCRICKIDCESVEGLNMHSQTREHQRMSMDMVKTIKQHNKKKSKISGDHAPTLEAGKGKNSSFES